MSESVLSWRISLTGSNGSQRLWFEGWNATAAEYDQGSWTRHRSRAEVFDDWPTAAKIAVALRRQRREDPLTRGKIVIMRTTTRRR